MESTSEWEVRGERERRERRWRSRGGGNAAGRLASVKTPPPDAQSSFTKVTQRCKQPRCLRPMREYSWLFRSADYYSALKRNELSLRGQAWRSLKCVPLSELSEAERLRDRDAKYNIL